MTDVDPPDYDLATLLQRAAGEMAQRLSDRLSDHGVTRAEWVLLALLHEAGAVPPSLLAERLGFTRGAVTKLVDRLRAKRLVVRARAGSTDRRYQTIALTGAGAVLVPRLRAVADLAGSDVFGRLTGPERATLARLLRAVVAPRKSCSHD